MAEGRKMSCRRQRSLSHRRWRKRAAGGMGCAVSPPGGPGRSPGRQAHFSLKKAANDNISSLFGLAGCGQDSPHANHACY